MVHKTAHNSFFMLTYKVVSNNMRQIGLIGGLIIAVIVSALGYMFWMNEKNKAAQRYFGFLVMEYNRGLQDKDVDWQMLLKKFERGYEKHAGSSLMPYYKDYAVNILLKQHKTDEAVALLDSIIADTESSPLLSLYQMEKALILLDMSDAEKQKQAEESLKSLAYDSLNQFHDSALFYLGRYYWAHDNIESARQVWQKLVDEQADEKAAPSAWTQQVKEYLKLIVA